MRHRSFRILAAAVIVTLALPAFVSALDNKTFNGVSCTSAGVISYLVQTKEGTMVLTDPGGPIALLCPLVRDNTTNTNGLNDLDLHAFNSASVSSTFACTAYALTTHGNVDDSSTQSKTTTGDISLNWGTAINVSSVGGNYVISCNLYYQDQINSYVSSEY